MRSLGDVVNRRPGTARGGAGRGRLASLDSPARVVSVLRRERQALAGRCRAQADEGR